MSNPLVISVESMDEEASEILYAFGRGHLVIFWNLRDYPIPSSASLESIYADIVSALRKMSFGAPVEVVMFGGKVDHLKRDPLKVEAKIRYVPYEGDSKIYWEPKEEVGESVADWNMAMHILSWAASNCRVKMLVLAKLEPEGEVYRVLQILKSKNISVLLLDPPPNTTAENLFHSVDSIIACTKVFEGGSPFTPDLY